MGAAPGARDESALYPTPSRATQWRNLNRERHVAAQREKRWRRMAALVARRGGRCTSCGWEPRRPLDLAALQFHHRDAATKRFILGGNLQRRMEVLEAEADKCDLLCANCHAIQHAEESLFHSIGKERET